MRSWKTCSAILFLITWLLKAFSSLPLFATSLLNSPCLLKHPSSPPFISQLLSSYCVAPRSSVRAIPLPNLHKGFCILKTLSLQVSTACRNVGKARIFKVKYSRKAKLYLNTNLLLCIKVSPKNDYALLIANELGSAERVFNEPPIFE
jgi:hypothetical protein